METESRLARSVQWRLRRATGRWRSLPDFIIIGAQRAGTTALFEHLAGHPQIDPAYRKEIHFFDLHYHQGANWYRSHFAWGRHPGRLTGESTPQYMIHPDVPERLAALVPEVKLILLLRDPVERAHSAWRLRKMEGNESRPFERAWQESEDPEAADGSRRSLHLLRFAYRHTSQYADHVERWYRTFDPERFHLVVSESLFSDPAATLAGLYDFLGVDGWEGEFKASNAATPAQLDPATRVRLTEHYAPYNRRLEELTGVSLPWA